MFYHPVFASLSYAAILLQVLQIQHWRTHHAILSLSAYAALVCFYVFLSFPVFLTAIAAFTMAVPLLLASMRLGYGALHPKQAPQNTSINLDYYGEVN